MISKVQKDDLGLFVVFGEWMARPLGVTTLKLGDAVTAQTVTGVATQVRPALESGAGEGARRQALGEAWLRCGVASMNTNLAQCTRNLAFFTGIGAADVVRLRSSLEAGVQRPVDSLPSLASAGIAALAAHVLARQAPLQLDAQAEAGAPADSPASAAAVPGGLFAAVEDADGEITIRIRQTRQEAIDALKQAIEEYDPDGEYTARGPGANSPRSVEAMKQELQMKGYLSVDMNLGHSYEVVEINDPQSLALIQRMQLKSSSAERIFCLPSITSFGDDQIYFRAGAGLTERTDDEIEAMVRREVERFNQQDARSEDGTCEDGRSVLENLQDALIAMGMEAITPRRARFRWDDSYPEKEPAVERPRG